MAHPLTKTKRDGVLYARPHSVEVKIDASLGQVWTTLSKQVRVTDQNSAEYLPSECLVHLIRDAIRRMDHRIASLLIRPLLVRCENNLKRTVSESEFRNAEAIRETILSSFQLLFTDAAVEDALDYYECRFAGAFRALRINHIRAAKTERKDLTDLPQIVNEDGDAMPEDEVFARFSAFARTGPSQENRVYLRQLLKAVDELPPDQRQAVMLRRILGHTEESAARLCNVEGRTIRNRLSRADETLKKLKEDL